MPTAAKVPLLKTALTRERRTKRRLRALIEEMREKFASTRHDVDVQRKRIGQVQAEVDLLKSTTSRFVGTGPAR